MSDLLKNRIANILILGTILLLAGGLRFYNLNWDQNQHLHPDERFLTMVVQGINWPKDTTQYFSTSTSPLNPFTQGYPFFVYGTFPLFFAKALADLFSSTGYNEFTLFGRGLSALTDLFVVFLIFITASKVFSKPVAYLASFIYSVSVLPIQLSHFFAVDTFLNFFMMATLYFLISIPFSPRIFAVIISGISFGLAFASKITAFLLAPAILLSFSLLFIKHRLKGVIIPVIFLLAGLIAYRIAQPYAFTGPTFFDLAINSSFIKPLQELRNYYQPNAYYPPVVQWHGTTPLLYPLQNMLFWWLGVPLGLLSILAVIVTGFRQTVKIPRLIRHPGSLGLSDFALYLLLLAVFSTFLYQGVEFAKFSRYFLPTLPPLTILTAYFMINEHRQLLNRANKKLVDLTFYFLIFTLLIWPLAFVSIYSRPHSRVLASEWIYQNIPQGAVLAEEHWDDSLPLVLSSDKNSQLYEVNQLPLFDHDSVEKWTLITEELEKADYIVITSNRVYGSVVRMPQRYPTTIRYYQKLFRGQLGYRQIAEISSYPSFLRFTANDDQADETFTVYDHPKVLIFKKELKLNSQELFAELHQSLSPNSP